MIDRRLIGDVGLAVLLAWPTVALSRPQAAVPDRADSSARLVEQAALVDQSPTERRFSLEG